MKASNNTYCLQTEDGAFDYVIERRPGRRTVGIQVRADGKVIIAAPPLMPVFYLKRVLRDKSGWVQKKLAEAAAVHAHKAARTYNEGDVIRFLGQEYRLQFCGRSRLDEESGILFLGLRGEAGGEPDRERGKVIAALTRWYKKQAQAVFAERAGVLCEKLGRQPTHIGIKGYKTRWGSCHTDGRIYFNWRLMMAPLAVVDYVAAHELAHLVHANHSPAFWQQVTVLFSDCRASRKWLRENGALLDL
ncbi:MAG: SprT family zinc-dependent metalloprotease [Mariprofundaceae bacterium]